jgi:adenosylmethionine-8-amino-7-oxononanoate aminotransferase
VGRDDARLRREQAYVDGQWCAPDGGDGRVRGVGLLAALVCVADADARRAFDADLKVGACVAW